MKKRSSILKSKNRNKTTSTKFSVSFSATTSTSTSTSTSTASNRDASISNHHHRHHPLRDKKYNEMTTQEEDALDPNPSGAILNGDNNKNAKIRDAKARRAARRHTTGSNTAVEAIDTDFDHNIGNDNCAGVGGEEMVDERFSLLHDGEGMDALSKRRDTSEEQGECPIEPFNLKSEREDGMGYFDGDTYVFRRNKGEEEEDAWLDNLNEEEEKERQIHTIPTKPKSESSKLDGRNDALTKEEAYEQLFPLLAPKETVLQALSRYGSIVTREKKQKIKDSASFHALNKITELCNTCMMRFDDGSNVYDYTREKMEQFLQESDYQESLKRKRNQRLDDVDNGDNDASLAKRPNTSISPSKTKDEVQWEYRGNEDNLIHGPYSTQQMIQWISAGYFVGKMSVDVRIVSSKDADTGIPSSSNEKTKEETVNDLLDDLEDSDTEDDTKKKTNNSQASQDWLRSDEVNFQSYL